MNFLSFADLEDSLDEDGLRFKLGDVLEEAKPGIRFMRGKTLDSRLPSCASKLGGFPDLPDGFPWPMGDPFADPAQRSDMLDAYDASSQGYAGPNPDDDRRESVLAMRKAALFQPFPLAFAGQLNLRTLSVEPGFDPVLPHRGLLSFFVDLRNLGDTGVRVIWFDQPDEMMLRRPHPELLVDYHDRENATGRLKPLSGHAEALHPYSVVTINEDRPETRPYDDEFREWREFLIGSPHPKLPVDPATEQTGVFLDFFCGWPHFVQRNPCNNMDGGPARWQCLFTWIMESHGGCFMGGHDATDLVCYVMIRKDDLAVGNFADTRIVSTD